MIINTTSSTPAGVYPIVVLASDGVITSKFKAVLDVGDYSVSIIPSSQTVLLGNTANFPIQVTSINNYGANFSSTCTGIPAPGVCTIYGFPSWSAQIQTTGLAIGSYNFAVALSNGVATRSASATLNVGDFGATLSANTLSVPVGQSGQVNIDVTSQNGFAHGESVLQRSPIRHKLYDQPQLRFANFRRNPRNDHSGGDQQASRKPWHGPDAEATLGVSAFARRSCRNRPHCFIKKTPPAGRSCCSGSPRFLDLLRRRLIRQRWWRRRRWWRWRRWRWRWQYLFRPDDSGQR
jgi:hypothetical protein